MRIAESVLAHSLGTPTRSGSTRLVFRGRAAAPNVPYLVVRDAFALCGSEAAALLERERGSGIA